MCLQSRCYRMGWVDHLPQMSKVAQHLLNNLAIVGIGKHIGNHSLTADNNYRNFDILPHPHPFMISAHV